jgi:hypothetical protein
MYRRTLSTVIFVALYGLIIVLAMKYLNKRNLWVFMFLTAVFFLYCQTFSRPQEYYFLPLVIILMFAPLEDLKVQYKKKNRLFLGVPVMVCLVLIFLCFPRLSGTILHIHPLKGGKSLASPGEVQSDGYLELSVGGNLRSIKALTFSIRRLDTFDNEPVRVTMTVNEKTYLNDVFQSRKIDIPIDPISQKKYFFRGGNSVRISLDRREKFRLSIRRGYSIDSN